MPSIILFDGYCNLCSATINFIIKHDENNLYSLISLQSGEGQDYLKQYDLATNNFDTVILIQNNQVYIKSTAALMIIKNLSGVVRHLHIFIYIPEIIRDFLYNIIAKTRFSIFGKRASCKINTTHSK